MNGQNYEFAVETSCLSKNFGAITAVDNVSFSVKKGEIVAIMGANGAGKSTLIKMLTGVIKPSSGTAGIMGYHIAKDSLKVRENIGYMSQSTSLLPKMTARENIFFYGSLFNMDTDNIKRRYSFLKDLFKIERYENKVIEDLTNGWRQMLSFMISVLAEPNILFLDEPSGGLDAVSRAEMWGHILGIAKEGTTIILTTHYLNEALNCSRVLNMDKGKLKDLGAPVSVEELTGQL